jgi:transcriptional regulator with XRE-family HTH domain
MKRIISPMNFKNDTLSVMNVINFSEWLRSQLDTAGITQAELSRRSGLSPSQVSKLLSMQSPPGKTAITAIAGALHIPKETVMRAAGLLPSVTDNDPRVERLLYLFNQLGDIDKDEIIQFEEMKIRLNIHRARPDSLQAQLKVVPKENLAETMNVVLNWLKENGVDVKPR